MAFTQTNNNYPSSGGGDKKKVNFRINKIYGTDGTIDVSIWNSDKGGVYTILTNRVAIGKDPTTGSSVYEQKMSNELSSIFLNIELSRAVIEALKKQIAAGSDINVSIDTLRGSKMSIVGNINSVKVTIEHQKNGTRTVTIEAVPVGITSINANLLNLTDYIEIGFRKACRNKLDPDEFGPTDDSSKGDDIPFA